MDKQKLAKGVEDRGGGKYLVRVMVKGKRSAKTYYDVDEANAAADAAREEPSFETVREAHRAESWTLKQAFDYAFTQDPEDGGWRGVKHGKSVRRVMGQLFAYFGEDRPLGLIRMSRKDDPQDSKTIDGFIAYCREGGVSVRKPTAKGRYFKTNKARTLNGKLSALRKVFKLAVARGGVDGMPAFPKARRVGSPKVRYYSHEEETEMLSLCYSLEKRQTAAGERKGGRHVIPQSQWTEFGDMLAVLIDTGMRWGECDATRKHHIDKRNREILVVGIGGDDDEGSKNGEERLVGLTGRAFDILTTRAAKDPEGRPFSLTYAACHNMFERLSKWMGLASDKHFTIHTARHTFCSRLVQSGSDLLVVRDLAGHKLLASTEVYSHLAPQNRRAAIAQLEKFNQSLNKVA